MELPKSYNPQEIEPRRAREWEERGFYRADATSGKPAFTIPMPPPNANGSLHLGHASMLAYQDILARYHRMRGDEVLWLPGTDHAGIQTQTVFERKLKAEGRSRDELGREKFYQELYEFCMTNKSVITSQIRMMGASCDWSREKFTLDADLVRQVQQTFVDMYRDGTAYRGYRITNWCPDCRTTLANIEVEHVDRETTLYFIKYTDELTVATVRPETKLADTGVAVHPDDSRYQHLIGRTLEVSLAGHKISVQVFADEEADPAFGTGAIGVTPAHSEVDYKMGKAHGLEILPLIGMDGLIGAQGGKYAGMTVVAAREAFVADLRAAGQLVREEKTVSSIAVCERSGTVIEPLLSTQWFVRVGELAKRAMDAVRAGETQILPHRFEKQFFHWMEKLEDWNISRQIWWGPAIPAWYCEREGCGEIVVQMETPRACTKCGAGAELLRKDPDTFDTWFSSGQWPYTILGGAGAEDFAKFYPTAVLETGWDILFFWVTRMMMLGLYRTGQVPFRTVYLHGLILDKNGAKMSKSKGNGIDPVQMAQQYGVDALRLSLAIGSKAGQSMRLYPEKVEGFAATMNKLWNMARFVFAQGLPEGETPLALVDGTGVRAEMSLADRWILARAQEVVRDATALIDDFQFGEAGRLVFAFAREEFADWYIEVAKIEKTQVSRQLLWIVLHKLLRLMHPFAPFITEEIWSHLDARARGQAGEWLIRAPWPRADEGCMDADAVCEFELVKEVASAVRAVRSEQQIAPSEKVRLFLWAQHAASRELLATQSELITRLTKASSIEFDTEAPTDSASALVRDIEISLALAAPRVQTPEEREKELVALREEFTRVTGFVAALEKKLANEKFVTGAPKEVVQLERTKLADQQAKLLAITQKINQLTNDSPQ